VIQGCTGSTMDRLAGDGWLLTDGSSNHQPSNFTNALFLFFLLQKRRRLRWFSSRDHRSGHVNPSRALESRCTTCTRHNQIHGSSSSKGSFTSSTQRGTRVINSGRRERWYDPFLAGWTYRNWFNERRSWTRWSLSQDLFQ